MSKALNTHDVGDVVEVEATMRDPVTEKPIEPTSVVCTVNAPDGTKTTPSVSNEGKGRYKADIPVDESGRWRYAFKGTGGRQGREEGEFKVRPQKVEE